MHERILRRPACSVKQLSQCSEALRSSVGTPAAKRLSVR
ncbi:hypothetical protein C7S14_3415 [Burkholderia cepacia]|nr:hypothetical protein C7S14_3415 [Burkholderia cepacia]